MKNRSLVLQKQSWQRRSMSIQSSGSHSRYWFGQEGDAQFASQHRASPRFVLAALWGLPPIWYTPPICWVHHTPMCTLNPGRMAHAPQSSALLRRRGAAEPRGDRGLPVGSARRRLGRSAHPFGRGSDGLLVALRIAFCRELRFGARFKGEVSGTLGRTLLWGGV